MGKGFDGTELSNNTQGAALPEAFNVDRRTMLKGGLGVAFAAAFGGLAGCSMFAKSVAPRIGFKSIAASTADAIIVPEGYTATAFMPWGCLRGSPTQAIRRLIKRCKWACTTMRCIISRWTAAGADCS
jgi:secreted PhoX family phosphatase